MRFRGNGGFAGQVRWTDGRLDISRDSRHDPIPIMPVIPIRRVGDMSERRQLKGIETHRGIPEEPAQQSFES
jgi:hypothetical protein